MRRKVTEASFLPATPPDGEPAVGLAAEVAALRQQLEERDRRLERMIERLAGRIDPADRGGSAEPPTPETDEFANEHRRFRRLVGSLVPRSACVAVVSRGDDRLLDLRGRRALHFPQAPDGRYAGYYPPDGTAVVAQLESLRAAGADYLAFPPSASWWRDSYPKLFQHVEARYACLADDAEAGRIYALEAPNQRVAEPSLEDVLRASAGRDSAVLDYDTGLDLGSSLEGRAVFRAPPGDGDALPYLDRSVPLVLMTEHPGSRREEARRVARSAVVVVRDDGSVADVEHLGTGESPAGVSIIIPTYNGLAHLVPCLRALEETLPEPFAGEVIVVDDASSDGTPEILAAWTARLPWLRVVRNGRNFGFISSCNRGARAAEHELLIFLNNDTLPLPGWLPPLCRTFEDYPDAGAVGGKLLFPDGRLQEAGGVIFRDGSGANFGRGDYEVDRPIYQCVRKVDYCSGALLATPRTLFEEMGGFDRSYRPAYYEDTDYCFTLKAHGHSVYYQPESAVIHVEGATAGTDESQGIKRYQSINRGKFSRKWSAELRSLPEPPRSYELSTWYRIAAGVRA